jgi:hypothetical protein
LRNGNGGLVMKIGFSKALILAITTEGISCVKYRFLKLGIFILLSAQVSSKHSDGSFN